jgi:hypothetical protein
MSLPVVSADPWEDDEEPRPGGTQEKFWLRRPDGKRALFKLPRENEGPQHVNDLVGARLAQAWGASAPDVQLFDHEMSGWGALVHELASPYMDFNQLPAAGEILAGRDRETVVNDINVRCMPIFDAIVNNQDRGGMHNSMVSWEESATGPLRYRHWFTDHGYCFEGSLSADQLEGAVQSGGGLDRYLERGIAKLRAALEEARTRWWDAVEDFCRLVLAFEPRALEGLLASVPGGLAPPLHLECIRARILYNQQSIREFVNGLGG